MGPRLVDHLLYEPEDSGILWIKFNRPERMNALVGSSEENGTVAKVGEYMRAGDDDPNIRMIVLTGVGRGFCSGANLGSRATPDITGENFPGNRGSVLEFVLLGTKPKSWSYLQSRNKCPLEAGCN